MFMYKKVCLEVFIGKSNIVSRENHFQKSVQKGLRELKEVFFRKGYVVKLLDYSTRVVVVLRFFCSRRKRGKLFGNFGSELEQS